MCKSNPIGYTVWKSNVLVTWYICITITTSNWFLRDPELVMTLMPSCNCCECTPKGLFCNCACTPGGIRFTNYLTLPIDATYPYCYMMRAPLFHEKGCTNSLWDKKNVSSDFLMLKEYSMILTISFLTWIRRYEQKKLTSKISVDSNFTFTSLYAWLCAWHCSIDNCVKSSLDDETYAKNCSHFIKKWFQPNSFREMCYLGESYKWMQ